MFKRYMLTLLLIVGLATTLFACNKGDSGLSVNNGASDAVATIKSDALSSSTDAVSTDKDSVVIALAREMESLDPVKGWGHGDAPILHATLVKYAPDMSIQKDLATAYELSADGLEWTFHLRKDAFFTDGRQLTAKDAAFTVNTCVADLTSSDLGFVEKAEAVDDFTLLIKLKEANSVLLNTLTAIGIVPEHAYDKETYGTKPLVSSGPYKFVEWQAGQQLILTANEDYYGEIPQIKKVTIVFMESDAALAAVRTGVVDVACTIPSLSLEAIDGYNLAKVRSVDNRGITLPLSPDKGEKTVSGYKIGNNVTSDRALRQAIAYGVNRRQLVERILYGHGRPAYSENDGMPWNNPAVHLEEDKNKAIEILQAGGWQDEDGDGIVEKDNIRAEFTVLYAAGDSVRQELATAVSEQLLQIGIKVNVEGSSWDDIAGRMFSEAVLMGWGSASPAESFYLYHSAGALLDDFYNPEGYRSELTDAYMKQALNASSNEEAYKYWQLAQWDGKDGTAMQGACPWVWLVNLDHLYFVRDGLDIGEQILHPHGNSVPLLQNLSTWKWH